MQFQSLPIKSLVSLAFKILTKHLKNENIITASKKEMIFTKKPTKSCHASTVLPLDNGAVAAAWFGGTSEGNNDVNIYTSVRNKSGVWSPPVLITADLNIAHWNPVLFKKADGSIIIYFKVGKKISEWKTYYSVSADGIDWEKPKELMPDDAGNGRGPVKNKPITLFDGTVLAGASDENEKLWRAFADISNDGGMTWSRTAYIEAADKNGKPVPMIQPTLWQTDSGNVHMLMRTRVGEIYRSDSSDNGKTWCKAYSSGLPNNYSGIDAVKDSSGRLFLAYTPLSCELRTPLVLAVSEDNGNTFDTVKILEWIPGEFSYPAITEKDNILHLTYTYKRKYIVYREFELKPKI